MKCEFENRRDLDSILTMFDAAGETFWNCLFRRLLIQERDIFSISDQSSSSASDMKNSTFFPRVTKKVRNRFFFCCIVCVHKICIFFAITSVSVNIKISFTTANFESRKRRTSEFETLQNFVKNKLSFNMIIFRISSCCRCHHVFEIHYILVFHVQCSLVCE